MFMFLLVSVSSMNLRCFRSLICNSWRRLIMSCCLLQCWGWPAVMLSPRLEAEILALASASASKLRPRPRPRGFGLGLALISLSCYVIGHFSYKNRVKFGNFVNFSGNNLKSYIVNHYLVLFSGSTLTVQNWHLCMAERWNGLTVVDIWVFTLRVDAL